VGIVATFFMRPDIPLDAVPASDDLPNHGELEFAGRSER
jgi:hypothetical protein